MNPSAITATQLPGTTPAGGVPGTPAASAAGATAQLGAGFAALLEALGLGGDLTATAATTGDATGDPLAALAEGEAGAASTTDSTTADAEALAATLAAAAAAVTSAPVVTAAPVATTETDGATVETATDDSAKSGTAAPNAPLTGECSTGVPATTPTPATSPAPAPTPLPPTTDAELPDTATPQTDLQATGTAGLANARAATPAPEHTKAATDDPLPSAKVSSVNGNGRAHGGKEQTEPDAQVAGARTAASPQDRNPQAEADLSGGHHGTAEGQHVELTQTVAGRDGEIGRVQSASATSPASPTRDLPHAPAAAATNPLHDVDELVKLSSLRGNAPLRDGGEMRLQVSPEGLGNVELRVSVRQDGVHAALFTDQDQARHALQANRGSLESALGRSNLRLEGFTVDMGFQQHAQSNGRGQQQSQGTPAQVFSKWFGPEASAANTVATTTVAAQAAQTAALHQGALSLRA